MNCYVCGLPLDKEVSVRFLPEYGGPCHDTFHKCVMALREDTSILRGKLAITAPPSAATSPSLEEHIMTTQAAMITDLRNKLAEQVDRSKELRLEIDAMNQKRDLRVDQLQTNNDQLREDRHRLASLFEKHAKDAQAIIEEIKPWG